jgi:hypothetical protein
MSRATAHWHWQYALVLIAWRLNGKRVLLKQSRSALLARVRAASA